MIVFVFRIVSVLRGFFVVMVFVVWWFVRFLSVRGFMRGLLFVRVSIWGCFSFLMELIVRSFLMG